MGRVILLFMVLGSLLGSLSGFSLRDATVNGNFTIHVEDFSLRMSSESGSPTEGSVTMYPNPAIDLITITASVGTHIEYLEIVSLATGTTVFEALVSPPTSYQLSLAAGSYLFKVENDLGQAFEEQIIIQSAP
jgi:hypothetical protein